MGGTPLAPKLRLFGSMGAAPQRERAQRRLEAFVAAEASRRFAPLKALEEAIGDGRLKGLARGVAYQLVENGGVLDRRKSAAPLYELSPRERRELRSFGVWFGAFSLYLPGLLAPDALALGDVFATLAAPGWRPGAGGLFKLPQPSPPITALSARGLRTVAGYAAKVLDLEAVGAAARAAPAGFALSAEWLAAAGWPATAADGILRALGFVALRDATGAATGLWKRRDGPAAPAPAPAKAPPVVAPAPSPTKARRRRRRRKSGRARAASGNDSAGA